MPDHCRVSGGVGDNVGSMRTTAVNLILFADLCSLNSTPPPLNIHYQILLIGHVPSEAVENPDPHDLIMAVYPQLI